MKDMTNGICPKIYFKLLLSKKPTENSPHFLLYRTPRPVCLFLFLAVPPPPLSGGSKTFFFGLDNINDSYFVIIYIAKYIYFD